jgi:hypothetical protein
MYPGNPGLDYGPAATNIRHAGAINGTWELPHEPLANPFAKELVDGWSLSGIATLRSGFPLSPQLGYNPTGNDDTRNPVRPNRAEFFNVLNHANFTTPNPVVYSSGPTPKTPTAEAAPSSTAGVVSATATTSRQIQFGLKLLF